MTARPGASTSSSRSPIRSASGARRRLRADSRLLTALQHRPPLEIFNLYLVDAETDDVLKWTPGDVIPVRYPGPPEPYLVEPPDLPAAGARDIFVDANLWLLQAQTVTRVNFGTPLAQEDYSLDPPPDATLRPDLDYRLLDGATSATGRPSTSTTRPTPDPRLPARRRLVPPPVAGPEEWR